MRRQLACLIIAAFAAPALAQDDADDFGAKLAAAAEKRCNGDDACRRRQMEAFDRLIQLEPGSTEEVMFEACEGSPLPYDADWEAAERCVRDRMERAPPPRL